MNIEQCHKILSTKADFSPSELKQRYKRLVKIWHPDRYLNNPQLKRRAERKIKDINIAYEQLIAHSSAFGRPMANGTQKGEHKGRGLFSDTFNALCTFVWLVYRFFGPLVDGIFTDGGVRKSKQVFLKPERSPVKPSLHTSSNQREFRQILKDAQSVRSANRNDRTPPSRAGETTAGSASRRYRPRKIIPGEGIKTSGNGRIKGVDRIRPISRIRSISRVD